jgi:phage shock protein C
MTSSRCIRYGGPYRSRNGIFFGVCRGLADHFDCSVFWMRIICIVTFIVSGFFPVVIAYVIAALLMRLEPALPFRDSGDAEFYNSYARSRPMALNRLRGTFESLDRRIQRIESIVTDREYDWDERLRNC